MYVPQGPYVGGYIGLWPYMASNVKKKKKKIAGTGFLDFKIVLTRGITL